MKSISLKWQLLIFLLITFVISWVEVYFIVSSGDGIDRTSRIFGLMWTPGLVGLTLSFVFGWRFKDIGFKIGNWRNYVLSYAVPAITAFLVLAALIVAGIGKFEISPKLIGQTGSVQGALLRALVIGPLVGGLISFVSGLGEEIGWRGFLHSKMIDLNWPHPFIITGIIWSVWHWPLILFSNYATTDNRILSVALFTVMATSLSVFMGWMRAKSGSVFTAALIHGVHNLWIQAIYPAFLKKGPLDQYFGGEFGVFNALFYLIVAVVIYRKFLIKGRPARTR